MTDTKDVQIERTFNAPIDLIWAMWTEAEHFANWYGPMGAKIPKAEMDVRIGGRRHIGMEMTTPNGDMQMFFVGEYRRDRSEDPSRVHREHGRRRRRPDDR